MSPRRVQRFFFCQRPQKQRAPILQSVEWCVVSTADSLSPEWDMQNNDIRFICLDDFSLTNPLIVNV